MDDLISRQAATQTALEFIVEYLGGAFDENFQRKLIERMNALPSAESELKRGEWEITNLGAVGVFDSCSECKRVVKHKAPFYNFCPNCGADMRGDKHEAD